MIQCWAHAQPRYELTYECHWRHVEENITVAIKQPESKQLLKKLRHYITKAMADYTMIQPEDRLLVCLSGGKDSYTMVDLLWRLRHSRDYHFDMHVYTLDQTQPGWDDSAMRDWLEQRQIPYTIEKRNTYKVVKDKIPEGKSYCSLCSRLRRGNIYRYAREEGFNKIALGHHRDDVIQTLLMSICYSGQICTMPPKLLTDDQSLIVIRPLVYCQESDIKRYAIAQRYPLIPCRLCGSQDNLARVRMRATIDELTAQNPKVPSNILHACQSVKPSQLWDKDLFDFAGLDQLIEH